MEATIRFKSFFKRSEKVTSISNARLSRTYIVRDIQAQGPMKDFLFTLGCYPEEEVTVISKLADNYIINIKDARYSIDTDLAKAIIL